MLLAGGYRIGTAARMGPGLFPMLLGGMMGVIGLSLALPALVRDGDKFPRLHLRPMLVMLASIIVFALLLQPLGFVVAGIALIVIGGFSDPDLPFIESVALAVFLTASSVLVFVLLLGLPFNLWPSL
jgi:hypothetical protein